MESLVVGITLVAMGLFAHAMLLRGVSRRVKAAERRFQFHGFRDKLQDLALAGVLTPSSASYRTMMWVCNFGIRNASVMRARDVPKILSSLDFSLLSGLVANRPEDAWNEVLPQVKELGTDIGIAFIKVMVLNDLFMTIWFGLRVYAAETGRDIASKLARALRRAIETVSPRRGRVIDHLDEYYSALT